MHYETASFIETYERKFFISGRNDRRRWILSVLYRRGSTLFCRVYGDDILLSQNSYQLIIANINNHKSPRDHKVRDTIIAIVDEFFRNNNSTLLYICETGDSKQSIRSRLFEYWFSTYNRKALFTMISSSIVDEEGVVNFATIILRNDNPNLSEIIAEFTESIQLLSQKPE